MDWLRNELAKFEAWLLGDSGIWNRGTSGTGLSIGTVIILALAAYVILTFTGIVKKNRSTWNR